jgi:AraC-like DNA-binding protein
VAGEQAVRLRQLHKLFHASGTTVAGWIRQRRLEHCEHDLRDPRWQSRPVAAVGARWGYPDPAHFSRLFKAHYGFCPRDYRAGGLAPYSPGQAPCAGVQDGRRPGT